MRLSRTLQQPPIRLPPSGIVRAGGASRGRQGNATAREHQQGEARGMRPSFLHLCGSVRSNALVTTVPFFLCFPMKFLDFFMVRMGARQAVQCNAGAGAARFVAQSTFRVTGWWACASKKWLADCGSTVPACARFCAECMAGVTARSRHPSSKCA